MQNVTVDGREYRVRVIYGSLRRSFAVVEGPNSGQAITAKYIRDIIGTGYSYTLDIEPDPRYPQDYDDFYEVITAPVESHSVIMPYGQDVLEFAAAVESGEDTLGPTLVGVTRWTGLSVTFTAIKPQREAV